MARIQWTPIVAPDIGSEAIRAQSMAGASLQNAFSGITGMLNDWEGSQREKNLAELYRRQNAFAGTNDVAGYQADIADGDLFAGMKYLRAADLASARDYTGNLRTGRQAEFAWDRSQVSAGREDRNDARSERDLETGVLVAREGQRIEAAVRSGAMTPEQGVAAAAARAARTQNAAQITSAYGAVDRGVTEGRGDTTWDRGTVQYNDSRQDRAWTVEDRNDAKAAEAIITQFREYGGNITAEDVIGSEAYQKASPGAQAQILAAFGNEGGGGAPAGGSFAGGSTDPNASWAERIGLVGSESGGNLTALNSEGYGGRLQFGADRLADAARAGIVPRGMSGAQFSRQPADVQRRVEDWHFQDIDRQAARAGINQFMGQTVAGVTINQNSIRAMAHLGGVDGVRRFVETGGRYNPADSNGTRLSDYGRRFGAINTRDLQGQATDVAVGATVAAATDRFGRLARTIVPAMNDDTPVLGVVRQLAESDQFRGTDEGRLGRLVREVQGRYARQSEGGNLSAAAAAQILLASAKPFDSGKDFFRNITGRSSGVGSTGGLTGKATNTVSWTDIDGMLGQLRPDAQGRIPLAASVRTQENRDTMIASATAGRAALETARANLAAAEASDLVRRTPNNPATLRMRRQFEQLNAQWGSFAGDAEGQLQETFGAVSPPPRQPVARGPAAAPVPVRRRTAVSPVYGD
jgi:hypothetical protein